MSSADIRFYFDPVCPFCWLTSKWIRMVQAERDLTVDWRFISLRLINSHIDYDAHFPPGYEAGHTAGLRLLRVAARARAEHGPQALDPLQAALGAHIFDAPRPADAPEGAMGGERFGTREVVEPILREVDRFVGCQGIGALSIQGWVVQASTMLGIVSLVQNAWHIVRRHVGSLQCCGRAP